MNGANSYFMRELSGENPFYSRSDYLRTTWDDLRVNHALPSISYTYNTEPKWSRTAKKILSIIIFPIWIYEKVHSLLSLFYLPAASYNVAVATEYRKQVRLCSKDEEYEGWKYKRLTIEMDNEKIDVKIVGKENTFANGKWLLASNGNGELCEGKFSDLQMGVAFKKMLTKLDGNAILFNYPGVAGSSGEPSRKAMAKAYRAVLAFLEDKEKGIGATKIVGYGLSIGGASQGEGIKNLKLKEDIKYVFVKDRTFSSMSKTASSLVGKIAGILTSILGWNMNNVESSKNLNVPEIILQSVCYKNNTIIREIRDSSDIVGDGVISEEASLAKALLDDPECPKENKVFFGITLGHNDGIPDHAMDVLTTKIDELLSC